METVVRHTIKSCGVARGNECFYLGLAYITEDHLPKDGQSGSVNGPTFRQTQMQS